MRAEKTLLGHPIGLYTLFFTELWERCSFYGMKAMLILYMLNYMVWSQKEASHVMAWYAGLIYCTPLLGGLLADKVFGARWSVLIGGVLMAVGQFMLTTGAMPFFYGGMGFLIVGCGLLKPNISTQVGSLYDPNDPRRDSAFTIFYMGINMGAFIGPLACAWVRVRYGYPPAFATAGVGMVVGLVVYVLGMRWVTERAAAVKAGLAGAGPTSASHTAGATAAPHAQVSIDRIIVLLVIFAFATVFWMCFEQASNPMTVWADQHTNLQPFNLQPVPAVIEGAGAATASPPSTGWRHWSLTAEQLQSVNPFFIITLAALFSWLWIWLDKRKKQPSTPTKMVLGVLGMTLAYASILMAARAENRPTSAALASLPPSVDLAANRYGATRLGFDAAAGKLQMQGVLTELDWLRALGDSAPEGFRRALEDLAKQAEQKGESMAPGTTWSVQVALAPGAPAPQPLGPWPAGVTWDAATQTFTATATLAERDLLRLRAAGADPVFRAALDQIYQESSLNKVTVWWLILFYLLCTLGELCLSPVGLSLVTKMAPPQYVGLFMGLWFVTTGGIANFAAHFIGGDWGTMTPTSYFSIFLVISVITMVLMILLLPFLKRRMHGIH